MNQNQCWVVNCLMRVKFYVKKISTNINNNNNNIHICIAPYGRNFRGATTLQLRRCAIQIDVYFTLLYLLRTATRSGGALKLPQRVRAEPGRQMYFRAINSPKFSNLLVLSACTKRPCDIFMTFFRNAGWLVGWSLTALSTQCRSYRAFKVRLY